MSGINAYTPFKMKAADYDNSPMKKNFGVGHPEAPEKPTPNKFGGAFKGLFGSSFAGGGGLGRVKALIAKHKANKEAKGAIGGAPEEGDEIAESENADLQAAQEPTGAETPKQGGLGGIMAKFGGAKQVGGGKMGDIDKRVSAIESLPQLKTSLDQNKLKGMSGIDAFRFKNKLKTDKMMGRQD